MIHQKPHESKPHESKPHESKPHESKPHESKPPESRGTAGFFTFNRHREVGDLPAVEAALRVGDN
jgi:hypothetical protein